MLLLLFWAKCKSISVKPFCLNLFGCGTCSLYGCDGCAGGYFLSASSYFNPTNFCLKCSYGCASCTNLTTCITCEANFLASGLGTCLCNNCAASDDISCQPGTYNDFNMFTCLPCPESLNCASCANATFCATCTPGYNLTAPHLRQAILIQACVPCADSFCEVCL
jgi:hypothetical protein